MSQFLTKRNFSPLPPSDAVQRQIFFRDLFSSEWSQFKKYHPSGNLKRDYLGPIQSLELRILMGKYQFLLSKVSLEILSVIG